MFQLDSVTWGVLRGAQERAADTACSCSSCGGQQAHQDSGLGLTCTVSFLAKCLWGQQASGCFWTQRLGYIEDSRILHSACLGAVNTSILDGSTVLALLLERNVRGGPTAAQLKSSCISESLSSCKIQGTTPILLPQQPYSLAVLARLSCAFEFLSPGLC